MEKILQLSYLYLIAMIPSMISIAECCFTKSQQQNSLNIEEENTIIEFIKTIISYQLSNEEVLDILTKPYALRICDDMKNFCDSNRQPNSSFNIGKNELCGRMLSNIPKSVENSFCKFLGRG